VLHDGPCPRALAIILMFGACAGGGEPRSARCPTVHSNAEESSPVQALATWPGSLEETRWTRPAAFTSLEPVRGIAGQPAAHEGDDYVHSDPTVREVVVRSAADGLVVYVRHGCPQSAPFAPNRLLRECAAGWGNHIIVRHRELYTRYAHLAKIEVTSGDRVMLGERLGTMGNSGRSDIRHLHFELGKRSRPVAPCGPSQSFDVIYEPTRLPFGQ
jgi:murein DD-endopeptidase MepM/ murein hydrolase activator NlpD